MGVPPKIFPPTFLQNFAADLRKFFVSLKSVKIGIAELFFGATFGDPYQHVLCGALGHIYAPHHFFDLLNKEEACLREMKPILLVFDDFEVFGERSNIKHPYKFSSLFNIVF